jgi:Cdc6-like AAA superfamily ATPase
VKDAWIRYVSRGRTAYRIIYIKHDDSIYLYRAGDHSIEDRLAKPKKLDNTIQVKEVKVEHDHFYDYGDLLKNSQPLLLREVITSMYHVGHREILLTNLKRLSIMIEFYAACNLTNNPFRSTPVRESDPRQNIWVGYDKEKQLLLKYIVRTRADQVGNDNFVIIYGDYGTGKTHALRWSKDYIQGAHQEDSVVYDIQTLKRDTVSFSAAFFQDIVEKSNLVSEVLKYKQFLQESAIEYQRENRILDSQDCLKKMLQSIELFHFAGLS